MPNKICEKKVRAQTYLDMYYCKHLICVCNVNISMRGSFLALLCTYGGRRSRETEKATENTEGSPPLLCQTMMEDRPNTDIPISSMVLPVHTVCVPILGYCTPQEDSPYHALPYLPLIRNRKRRKKCIFVQILNL